MGTCIDVFLEENFSMAHTILLWDYEIWTSSKWEMEKYLSSQCHFYRGHLDLFTYVAKKKM